MSSIPQTAPSDQDSLRAFSRSASAEHLRPVVERYLPLVYSSAHRRTGNPEQAMEVARATFLVLARRARRMRRRTVLAGWLFQVTAVASRKLPPGGTWRWFGRSRRARSALPPEAPFWMRVAPEIDSALDKLPPKTREAVLLHTLLGCEWKSAAKLLRTSERRVQNRFARGLKKMARRLRKRGIASQVDAAALAVACEANRAGAPAGLESEILASIEESRGRRPALKLARGTLTTLAWARWRRRFAIGIPCFILSFLLIAGVAWHLDSLSGHSRSITAFLIWSMRNEARRVPGLAQPARAWPADAATPRLNAAGIRSARDLYQTTNIWLAHLKFSREQWKALEPKHIGPLPHFLQPDGTVLLRHPAAQRSGLAGVLGWDFNWAHADLEFGGLRFTNVASRFKGNGTYLSSLHGVKTPFKVDLNEFVKGQKLGGVDELNFHNLVDDRSCLSDTLAYEFFRDAAVPAPRTAYAYLSVTVDEKWDRKPLGLYLMVEPVDEEFAKERFGKKKTAIFKPVTYELFQYLGDDWSAYEAIYDAKTKPGVRQQRRVIELARLVTYADDADFARRVGDFLDLDEFARFLAGEVLLSAYDSFLSNGQNYYLYLDPDSDRFGFIPWDMDLAWGGFFLLGSTKQREQASIWHPWVGEHRLLERVMSVEKFREIYRACLEDFLERLFVPRRLHQRIDELAEIIRDPVAAESDFRLGKFDQSIGRTKLERTAGSNPHGADRPVHQLKPFIEKRVRSVRAQLDGRSEGVILHRSERK